MDQYLFQFIINVGVTSADVVTNNNEAAWEQPQIPDVVRMTMCANNNPNSICSQSLTSQSCNKNWLLSDYYN